MAIVLALPKLFDAVVARFAADGLSVPNLFGWRPPHQRETQSARIVWVPGDMDGGTLGDLGPAKQPGRDPRPLATLNELFTVLIRSSNAATPENERAQYQAVRELYDAWYRACWRAARNTFFVQDQRWVVDQNDRRHGAELRVLCSIEAMIPDTANTDVTDETVSGDLTTALEDVEENDLIAGTG